MQPSFTPPLAVFGQLSTSSSTLTNAWPWGHPLRGPPPGRQTLPSC